MAKVFVVDDESAMRRVIATQLRLRGHEMVLQAGSLSEALEELDKIGELGVSVAVVDGAFPNRGDGDSLAAALRAATPCVRIISFSGEDDVQTWGDKNLKKPDDFLQLCQAIESVLKA